MPKGSSTCSNFKFALIKMNGSLFFDRNEYMDDLSEYNCTQEFHFMKNHKINNTMLVDCLSSK